MISFQYKCIDCGAEYPIVAERMLCPVCAATRKDTEPLRGVLEVELEGDLPQNWTIFDFLPVPEEFFPPIPVGNTPLWEPARLREEHQLPRLFLKDDTCNPTGSFKDRASYLVAAFAKQQGIGEITLASTGNAGSSMAGVGAAAGLKVKLFLPATAPPAKIVQARQYGAELIVVDGNYDQAYELSLAESSEKGGMNRNTAYNPMTIEGKKTVSLELFQQLGKAPNHVFVGTGDGVIISGVFKGFEDLLQMKLIDKMPTIYAVQAEGSAAISNALKTGTFEPVEAKTIADSISVDVPRGGYFALQRLQRHKGKAVVVSDDEILHAQHDLARKSGLFAEPAAATAFAGFLKVRKNLNKDETVVVLLTGSGLKDIAAAEKGVKHER